MAPVKRASAKITDAGRLSQQHVFVRVTGCVLTNVTDVRFSSQNETRWAAAAHQKLSHAAPRKRVIPPDIMLHGVLSRLACTSVGTKRKQAKSKERTLAAEPARTGVEEGVGWVRARKSGPPCVCVGGGR